MKQPDNEFSLKGKFILEDIKFPFIIGTAIFIFLLLSYVLFAEPEETIIYFIGASLGLLLTYFMFTRPIIWLYLVILSSPFFLLSRGDDLSPTKLIPYLILIPGLILWLLNTVFAKREKLIRNPGDAAFLIFFFFVTFNIIIAELNGGELSSWLKEYFSLYILLLYFPIRHHIKTEKEYRILIFVFLIAMIAVAGFQMLIFRVIMNNAIYMYQVASSLRINMTLLGFTIIFGVILFISEKTFWLRLFAFLASILSLGCIITSFARTMWLIDLALLIFTFFILDMRHKIRYSFVVGLSLLIFVGAFLIIFSGNFSVYLNLMQNKFSSSTLGTKDPSIVVRMVEYDAVLDRIEELPLGGNGMGVKFAHKDNIEGNTTHRKHFVHNSYLQYLYTYGYPLAIIYFFFLLYYVYLAVYKLFKEKENNKRIRIYFGLIGMLIVIGASFSSAQLSSKESILLLALSIFFIEFEVKESNKSLLQQSNNNT